MKNIVHERMRNSFYKNKILNYRSMGILKTGIVCAGALLAAGAAETAYFYGRTMKRQNVNMDRTIKMAGTDWSQ